jgi:predicted metalloprotease with PDZ domain
LHPREAFWAAWRPFLTSKGGLFGGPQSFIYVVGATLAPSHVIVEIPQDWRIATGLIPTSDPKTFFAATVSVLVESPIMIGSFKSWYFSVDGVTHHIAYWPLSSAASFDSTTLLSTMQGLVQQASLLFGRLPYREYSFMLLDSSWGGLEHNNSVTLGAPVGHLQNDRKDFLNELSHEYFHTWNLMRIHPVE